MLVAPDYDVIAKVKTIAVHVDGESWLDNRKCLCLRNVSE